MDFSLKSIQTENALKAFSLMMSEKALVNTFIKTVISMKEIIRAIFSTAMEKFHTLMEFPTLEIGKKAR